MMAAEARPGAPLEVLASDREVTRLGTGVFSQGIITRDAMDRVCLVLARMASAYQNLNVMAVRAVATSAVRDAGNQQEFIDRASSALGSPVEIISGQEEARLIHLGVQAHWPHPKQRILVVDIGGGSAEIMVGVNGHMISGVSKPLGAVRLTEMFLASDPAAKSELERMNDYIEEKLEAVPRQAGRSGFDRAIATSATAAAVVCAVNRVARSRRENADRLRATSAQIRRLYQQLCASSLAQRQKAPGIGPRRAEIIVAGTAVLARTLAAFQCPSVYYSSAGVRDGVIADLAARSAGAELTRLDADQRRAVQEMARRFGVEIHHARKVADLAATLFVSLQTLHLLPHSAGKLLEAAAYLHDTGHYISGMAHHKHSHYIVANSGVPGFTESERRVIAALCRFHRKSMPASRHEVFQQLSSAERRLVWLLVPLLRIADALDRSHNQRVESVDCLFRNGDVVLSLASTAGTNLELWAGERVADVFRQVFGRGLLLERQSR